MITKKIILSLIFLLQGYQYLYAQNFLTKGEVYNYEIGDEFHYHLSRPWMFNDYYIHRVLNKYTTSSHLYYEMGNIDKSNGNNILSTFLDSIPLAVLQNPIVDTNSAWLFADTICTSTDSIIINNNYNGLPYQYFNFTLNVPDNYEPPFWSEHYGKGIGRTRYYYVTMGGYLSIDLVYFKKDTVVWGNDVYITAISELEQQQNWKIFPNPFTNHVSITIDNIAGENLNFLLYNNIGQLVWETKIITSQTVHTVALPTILASGVYHAILRDDKQQQIIKIVKE